MYIFAVGQHFKWRHLCWKTEQWWK